LIYTGVNTANARLILAFLFAFGAGGQDFPAPARHHRCKDKAPTPARIVVGGPGPYTPLARPVTIRMVQASPEQKPSTYTTTFPTKIALARSAAGSANSPEASGVLDAAGKLSHKFLNVELPMPDFSATLTHNGEDIAVATWRPACAQVVAPILLWDDPQPWFCRSLRL
jgi:hypothetical protein